MQKKETKFIGLFEKYGTLNSFDEDPKMPRLYKFSCDTKQMYDKDDVLSTMGIINFAIVLKPNNECLIFCFRVGTQKGVENDILYIINEVNKSSEYGKYTLAANGDIDWAFRFDIEKINIEDIKEILTSFFNSILRFAVLVREYKFQKKE